MKKSEKKDACLLPMNITPNDGLKIKNSISVFSDTPWERRSHFSRLTKIFIIFQRFPFTPAERQSSVNAIKRCKRLFESAIQHSELVLPFLDTVEEILSSLLPRFDSLCLFCRMRASETKRGETVSFCSGPYRSTTRR